MKLKRPLGALDVFCIAAGAMISSGLFVLPGLVYLKTGPSIILVYVLAGVLMIPSVLAKAELATAMPKAGGTYFFVERSLGPLAGTVVGFAHWFAVSFKSAFALVGMGAFAGLLLPSDLAPESQELLMRAVAAGCCVFFVLLNVLSVRQTGRFQIALVLALLGILIAYAALGAPSINVQNYTPFVREGFGGLLAATGMVFISYGGLTKVASVGEEVKRPGRNLPLGMLSAFVVVSLLYVAVVAVTVGVAPEGLAGGTRTPLSDAAAAFLGRPGLIVLSLAALLAFVTTANAGILAASRGPMAMSRDELVPRFFAAVNRRFQTPHFAILCTGLFMLCVILFLRLETLVKTASTLMLLLFIWVNVSLLVMRASRIHSYRPKFRCPGYPWMQIAAVLVYGVLISEMGWLPLATTAGFLVLALAWYVVYVPAKVKRRSALVRVVERVVDRKLGVDTLETELTDILVEREGIVHDRFDRLIKDCTILDIEGPTDYEAFFRSVAYHVSEHLHTSADGLYAQLLERERESTTAIAPGLAIPHVIIRGEGKFDILLARCRNGVTFRKSLPPVHTVFVLLGTRDERTFHLKSLMSIAQIAQNPRFKELWLAARDKTELRNIILLAARERDAAE